MRKHKKPRLKFDFGGLPALLLSFAALITALAKAAELILK